MKLYTIAWQNRPLVCLENRPGFRTHVGNDWQLYCPVCGRKTWFTARKRGQ